MCVTISSSLEEYTNNSFFFFKSLNANEGLGLILALNFAMKLKTQEFQRKMRFPFLFIFFFFFFVFLFSCYIKQKRKNVEEWKEVLYTLPRCRKCLDCKLTRLVHSILHWDGRKLKIYHASLS